MARMHPKHRRCAALLSLSAVAVLGLDCGRSRQVSPPGARAEDAELTEIKNQGNRRFRAGQYAGAVELYQKGYEEAIRRGNRRSAMRFLNNLGGAQYQLFHYRDALKAYLE